ncbi:MAG: DUF1616 domain-containing protein [Methanomicrobiaceae archaeon]|nr:DUF1616 domain-containing protein [Methanomicrobiaceae archaeon]
MTGDDEIDRIFAAFLPERIFKDIISIFIWLIFAVLFIYVPILNETFLRVVFALPVVLFIPGYALIAALFPGNKDIDGIERTALSFGLSIAVVPLIGLALNYTPWGIRLDPIVTSLVIFTLAMLFIAQFRRAELPEDERFEVPLQPMIKEAKEELFPKESTKTDRILSIILIISIIAAIATTIFVIVVPKEGEKFTEFYILGEKGMAADYPTKFYAGTSQNVTIGIGNHEYRDISYFVEVFAVNQIFNEETNTSSINEMSLLGREEVLVPENSTTEFDYTFSINDPKINKIQFLLFADSYPENSVTKFDRINESYRDLHLWVDVREPVSAL